MIAEWPQMMFRADGARKVFAKAEDVSEGWLTAEHLAALDHDGDQVMGGSIRPVSDEHVHVPADYEAPPTMPKPKRRRRK